MESIRTRVAITLIEKNYRLFINDQLYKVSKKLALEIILKNKMIQIDSGDEFGVKQWTTENWVPEGSKSC